MREPKLKSSSSSSIDIDIGDREVKEGIRIHRYRRSAKMEGPLDFEFEDPIIPSSLPNHNNNNKRKKVITLDELLSDHYKEKRRIMKQESKRAKIMKNYNSDEDDDAKEREAKFSRCLDKLLLLFENKRL